MHWTFEDGSKLKLLANLAATPFSGLRSPASQMIYATEEVSTHALEQGMLPAWSVAWFLES